MGVVGCIKLYERLINSALVPSEEAWLCAREGVAGLLRVLLDDPCVQRAAAECCCSMPAGGEKELPRVLLYGLNAIWALLVVASVGLGSVVHQGFYFLSIGGLVLIVLTCGTYSIHRTCSDPGSDVEALDQPPTVEEERVTPPPSYEEAIRVQTDDPPGYQEVLRTLTGPKTPPEQLRGGETECLLARETPVQAEK